MTHSNRLPDAKYQEIKSILKKAWPPGSVQEAIGMRHLPYESFEELADYSKIEGCSEDQRANLAALVCCHADARMRAKIGSGYLEDDSAGVAMVINKYRCASLRRHRGFWGAISSYTRRNEMVDIVCDDVRELVSGWQTVKFMTSSKSCARIFINESTRNLEDLKHTPFVHTLVLEADDDQLAGTVKRFTAGYNPIIEVVPTSMAVE
jgi:hypothetical protein